MSRDHSKGATPYHDINPFGKMSHDLPHRYLPLTGNDRRWKDGGFQEDDGQTCQFTAGGQRCQGTLREHKIKWPEVTFRDTHTQVWLRVVVQRLEIELDDGVDEPNFTEMADHDFKFFARQNEQRFFTPNPDYPPELSFTVNVGVSNGDELDTIWVPFEEA